MIAYGYFLFNSLSLSSLRYTCRGLFERHKLLFSFQMCVKIMENAHKLNMDEYSFFLRGGIVSYRLKYNYSYTQNYTIRVW